MMQFFKLTKKIMTKTLWNSCFIFLILLGTLQPLKADNTWILPFPAVGNWTTSTNWFPNTNPLTEPGDHAFIDDVSNGGTAEITSTVAPLIFSSDSGVIVGSTNGNATIFIHGVGDIPSSHEGVIGQSLGLTGTIIVDGPSTNYTVDETANTGGPGVGTGNLFVGQAGGGNLKVLNGGFVRDSHGIIGANAGSNGFVLVTDPNSFWVNALDLIIGESGTGQLDIDNGGRAIFSPFFMPPPETRIALNPGSIGTLNLNGNALQRGLLNTNVVIGGAGNSTINFNGGILQANTNNAVLISGITQANILAGGAFIDTQSLTVTVPQVLTGPGQLFKLGTGTLILTGTNLYTGGTTISAGTLQVNTNSLPTGNVLNQGSLVFDQAFLGTFAGNISGSGTLTKNNGGTLILTGNNTYQGGTIINAGVLQGNTNSIPSATVINNATLVFDQNFDGTFSGSIFGAGALFKQGIAKLQLTGNSGTFTGPTTVVSGDLNVNGILGGTVTVNSGATLSGNGFLNTVFNNGTISPGNNNIGTLHVNNLFNSGTGIYLNEISSSGAADLIQASGVVTLAGGELRVIAQPGIYLAGTTYTIINAAGGLNGQFAVHTFPANVLLFPTYLPQQLILTVLATSFDTTGLSGNALRVARFIQNHVPLSADFLTVAAALSTLNRHQLQKALDQLHPAIFQALSITASDTAHMITRTFDDRMEFLRERCCDSCNTCRCTCGGIWLAGAADFVRQKRTDGLRRFTNSSEGLAIGFDKKFCSFFAGIGAGYSHTNLHWGNSAGHANIDGYYFGPYITHCNDCLYFDAAVLGFYNHHRVRRRIDFATIHRKAKNNHDSYGVNPHLGGGFYWNYCSIDVIPFFEADYYFVEQAKYREHGAQSLNLHVRRNRANFLRLETGVKLSQCVDFFGISLSPTLSVSYVLHKVLSGNRFKSSFGGANKDFAVFGTRRCFNQVEVGAGVQYFICDKLAVNVWYDFEFGEHREEQEVNLEINYNF